MEVCHAERRDASQRAQGWRPVAGLRVTTSMVERM